MTSVAILGAQGPHLSSNRCRHRILVTAGIHPQVVANAFSLAVNKAESILTDMAIPIDLDDRESLLKNAVTSLNSKVRQSKMLTMAILDSCVLTVVRHAQVVSQNSHLLAPIAVDAVLKVIDPATATNVDLRDIRVRIPFCRRLLTLCSEPISTLPDRQEGRRHNRRYRAHRRLGLHTEG